MKRTSQTLPPKLPPKFGTLGGKEPPNSQTPIYILIYILGVCEVFWEVSPTPVSPLLGGFGSFWEVAIFDRRETKATKTCHHKSHTYALVDANGLDVWHTLANMRLICAAVNGNRHQ